MSKELDHSKNLVIENIFRKSLYGIINNENEIKKYLGSHFTMPCFIMGSLVLENDQYGNINKLNEFIIQNVFQEVLGDKYDLYVIDYYKGYLLIANFLENYHEYLYEDTLSRLNTGRSFLEDQLDLPYILTISNLYTDINSLSIAYTEVQNALEYRTLFSNEKLITYNSTKKEEKPYLYYLEDQIALIKFIKSGDIEGALHFIEKLFNKAFKNRDISLEDTKRILLDLQTTLEQIAYELNIDFSSLEKYTHHRKTIQQIKKEFKEFIILLCNDIHKQNEQTIDTKIKEIITYIEKNYTDNNLTVSQIADVFDVNISYLSRFFKKNMNENLLQYITKYRIKKAKNLLIHTDYNLNEVAQKVGLLNNVALIRSFKKYEYMTPNEYRIKYKI